jgi:hypothetical protein
MATLKEIEGRIQDYEKRLIELGVNAKNNEKIRVTTNLIAFWKNQKKKVLRIENRLKSNES